MGADLRQERLHEGSKAIEGPSAFCIYTGLNAFAENLVTNGLTESEFRPALWMFHDCVSPDGRDSI